MGKGAYHGSLYLKEKLLTQLQQDWEAGRITQKVYWEYSEARQDYCGCLIGCSLHEDPGGIHQYYSERYNIPKNLAHTFDFLFENLPLEAAQRFTIHVHKAIPVGADLSLIIPRLIHWLLGDPEMGIKNYCTYQEEQDAIQEIIECYKQVLQGTISLEYLEQVFRHKHFLQGEWSDVLHYAVQPGALFNLGAMVHQIVWGSKEREYQGKERFLQTTVAKLLSLLEQAPAVSLV